MTSYVRPRSVKLSSKSKTVIQKMIKGEECSFESTNLSKRVWRRLMEFFGFKKKIL